MNKEPNRLSIRIPRIRQEDIDDLEMMSPEPKKRKISDRENDDNSKKRRSNPCGWMIGMFLSLLVCITMLPETLAYNIEDEHIIHQKCNSAINVTITCIVLAFCGCMFFSAMDDESRRGITNYSNFKMMMAVLLPIIIYIYS
jgi:hypothetical protein